MRRKRRERAKDRQARVILELARRNGGVVKLAEVTEVIGTGKSYAHRLLLWLVEEGYMQRRGYGVYQMRKNHLE